MKTIIIIIIITTLWWLSRHNSETCLPSFKFETLIFCREIKGSLINSYITEYTKYLNLSIYCH